MNLENPFRDFFAMCVADIWCLVGFHRVCGAVHRDRRRLKYWSQRSQGPYHDRDMLPCSPSWSWYIIAEIAMYKRYLNISFLKCRLRNCFSIFGPWDLGRGWFQVVFMGISLTKLLWSKIFTTHGLFFVFKIKLMNFNWKFWGCVHEFKVLLKW